ncbi:MAG: lasso peptide biosynthesis B2 protein, partial [Rhodothermales bacterium]|nr:lasso peptide biosynthesis B2 protein [Rhodothermales bacterium]
GAHRPARRRSRRIASRIATLRPAEVGLLVRMSVMLAALLVLQRVLSLPRLLAVFDPRTRRVASAPVSPDRLAWLTKSLLRVSFRDRYCMKQSVLLFHFLKKWGHPVRLHFGVAKHAEELTGHAWIELGGIPFAEQSDPREAFQVTYSYPAP